MLDIIYLVGGLALIIIAANILIDGSASLAKRFNVSDLVIGLTIIAFGTSAPELTINIFSSLNGSTDLAIGNILGSNIANILLILGITGLITPLVVQKTTQAIEIPLTLMAVVAMAVLANDVFINGDTENIISRSDGITLLLFFSVFMYYMAHITIQSKDTPEAESSSEPVKIMPMWKSAAFITGGLAGLFFGGQIMVEGAVNIAKQLGMSESVIGLTIVALGTSLPELAASVAAALKKNADMAIGNVVGSNIFNIFMTLGVSATINPLPMSSSSNFDILIAGIASALLFLSTVAFGKRKIIRGEAFLFLSIYVAYIVYLLVSQ